MGASSQTVVTMYRHFHTVEVRDREYRFFNNMVTTEYYSQKVSTDVRNPSVHYSATPVDCGDILFAKSPEVSTVTCMPVLKNIRESKALQSRSMRPFPAPFHLYVDYGSLETPNCDFQLKNIVSSPFELSCEALLITIARQLWPNQSSVELLVPKVSPSLWGRTDQFEFMCSSYQTKYYNLFSLIKENKLCFGPPHKLCATPNLGLDRSSREVMMAFLVNNKSDIFIRVRLVTSPYKLFAVIELKINNVQRRFSHFPVTFHDGKWLKVGEDREERLASNVDPSLPTLLQSMTNNVYVAPIPRLITLRNHGEIKVSRSYLTKITAKVFDMLLPISSPIPE